MKRIGREIAMALRSAYLSMHREADAVLQPFGLTANQFVVLLVLTSEELTQNSLADRIASDRNTIRPILLSLEKRKLIRRTIHPTDGRARVVRLTKLGWKKYEEVQAADAAFRNRLSAPFSRREQAELVGLLGRIRDVFKLVEDEVCVEPSIA